METVLVIAAGAFGALLRAEVAWWSLRRTRDVRSGTWVVNIVGAFALGLVVALVARGVLPDPAAHILGAGLLGGLTTFSTWMLVVLRPAAAPHRTITHRVLVHGIGMLIAGVVAAAVGALLAAAL